MSIQFNEISNLNIPFVFAELVKSDKVIGTVKQPYTSLLFGQKTTAGTAGTETILDVFSESQAKLLFGTNSMLAHAAGRYFKINKSVSLKVIALDDNAAGTVSTGDITLTGTATGTGTLSFYINGNVYTAAVAIGDTAAEIATLLTAAINENTAEQVTAIATAGEVGLTSIHKGTYGNELKLRINYNSDESTPLGITSVITAMNGGAGNPVLTNTLTILEENQFNLIAQPYTDNASLILIDTALTDNFKATEMLDGFCLVGVDDTVTNLTTKTNAINSAFITVLDNNTVFSTGFEHAAGVIAKIADNAQSNPGGGYLGFELFGFLPLTQRIRTERNSLAGGGVSTYTVVGSSIRYDRTVTTLQKDENAIAIPIDDRDLRVFLTISYVRYSFVSLMSQFQNYKVGGDDDIFGAGTLVITPNIYKQNLIIIYSQLVTDAVCEDLAAFEASIIVERAGNRINSSMNINIINVLIQQSMRINYEV